MTAARSVAVPDDARSARSVAGIGRHARTRPALGLRTPPLLEPRYDDEHPPDGCPAAGELLPFEEPSPRRFEHDVDFFDPQPTSRRCLPEPGPWAAHFIQAALEMLAGRRPLGQLQRWATLPAVAGVKSATRRRTDRTMPARRTGPPGRTVPAGRAAPAGPATPAERPADTLHSVHISQPADGVAEVCAVVRRGQRYQALAARMEGLDGRWQCVSFRLL